MAHARTKASAAWVTTESSTIMLGLAGRRNSGSRAFPQATSQGLVKSHEVLKALQPHDLQLLLRVVEGALSIELAEIVVDSAAKAHLRQAVRFLRGGYQSLLRGQLLVEAASSRERVGHF